VLNALRHQRNWNRPGQRQSLVAPLVLNALRHQRNWNDVESHLLPRNERAQRLTASKELELAVQGAIAACKIKCSTPYGIKGIGTCWWEVGRTVIGSAQRLTASKELEQKSPILQVKSHILCSTPYGIKGIGTV
jgi:hypothetical protein